MARACILRRLNPGLTLDSTRPRSTPSVVVVEDDPSLLRALTFALEAEGLSVHSYRAGKALLSSPVHADCLVVDYRLPDLDGLSLIAALREKGVSSPAILTTTNPDQRTRRLAAAAGVAIVEKPLLTSELRSRIDELIEGEPRRSISGLWEPPAIPM
jgi:DNA-binding response OmpR family regulator